MNGREKFWTAAIIVGILLLFGGVWYLWYKADQANRAECGEHGRVIEIRGNGRGWFCEENK